MFNVTENRERHDMYITGTQYDYINRMHELTCMGLPTGAQYIIVGMSGWNNFVKEADNYLHLSGGATATAQESGRWEVEARQQLYMLSGLNAMALLTQVYH